MSTTRQQINERAKVATTLHDAGFPPSMIAKLSGIPIGTIYGILARHRPQPKKPDITAPRQIEEISPAETDEFWSKVDMAPGHGPTGTCWIWTGGRTGTDSKYGYMTINGRKVSARAVSFRLYSGRSPALALGATCGMGLCVNPEHLMELHSRKEALLFAKMHRAAKS